MRGAGHGSAGVPPTVSHTTVHGVELITDRDRIALLVEGSPIFPSTREGPQDFEPETAAAFVAAVQADPWCVIDVGAYTGLFTILALRAGASEVIALEPNEAGYERLLQNIRNNGLPENVQAIQAAVSEFVGTGFLTIASERLGICSTGKVATTPIEGARPVHLRTIDSIYRHRRVSVIKMDVEGHELSVLMGATGTLKADRPTLFVEVNSRSGGDRTDAVTGFLADFGYQGQPLDERNMVFRP